MFFIDYHDAPPLMHKAEALLGAGLHHLHYLREDMARPSPEENMRLIRQRCLALAEQAQNREMYDEFLHQTGCLALNEHLTAGEGVPHD